MKVGKFLIVVGIVGGLVASCGSSDSKKTSRATSYDGGGESSAGNGSDVEANDAGQAAVPVGAEAGAGS
jgi:hypothetical protein